MITRTYQNFDLLMTRTATGYNARVIESPAGQANVDFVLPFTQAELSSFFWLSNHALRNLRPSATNDVLPLDPKRFGMRLYEAVFAGGVGKVFLRSLDAVRHSDTGLRLCLRLGDTPELADLPWEYLYVTDLVRHPALSDQTPLVRYLELPLAEPTVAAALPLHVLAVVAAPSDLPPLNNDQEWTRLQSALADLQTHSLITLERLESATPTALQRRLRQGDVHILHFIGHGFFDPEQETGGLFFETDIGQGHLLPAERLGTLLHDHRALRLVFLNACEGARGGAHNVFSGVAQTLVQQGIPAVLAMQFPVSDQAAIALSHEFYKALADGYAVDAAVTEARKAIYTAGDEREWGTPVLFSRSPDNQLLAVATDNTSGAGDVLAVTQIQSAGGPVVQGNVTAGGDFVGRDHVTIVVQRPEDAIQLQTEIQRTAALRTGDFVRLPFEPETALIPGGLFVMGSDRDEPNEAPQHEVTLPDFRMGKYPVTNRQYAVFLKRTGHPAPQKPRWFLQDPPPGKEQHPVTGVSWHDAFAYCAWLNRETDRTYRLPSEAEWEKAARGEDGRRYPWNGAWRDGVCTVNTNDTTPVDAYPDGASPYGCLDLLGNVQEWTNTLWGSQRDNCEYPYPYRADDGREEPNAGEHLARVFRIHRGGCYRDQPAELRCSARGASVPESAVSWRGFRVMMAL